MARAIPSSTIASANSGVEILFASHETEKEYNLVFNACDKTCYLAN